ncbi:Small-conductance mechanosensitive channel [Enhydrobacter aerosaccus]|uniref:Small-conductance mechanosensitive channel n=1 Tax=Enhydrobacter aerosaccus TaxID=225324 RepID=A0A1T4JN57_9HYPH|nr:mechanosensitive ion channel family protein [Enhydrobacter aerosaccus]SJZ31593.1 Small-conductance mechanosensitive channel [Enhydrobacter aerosaccus]
MPLQDLFTEIGRLAGWLPDWLITAAAFVLAAALALLVHGAVVRLAHRLVPPRFVFLQTLLSSTRDLSRVALVLVAMATVLPVVPLGKEATNIVAHWLFVAFIGLVGWASITALMLATDVYLARSTINEQSNALARKHVTQVRVLRRVTVTLVIIITVAAALMTFNSVKQYGVSLIASAGAAGIVVGLAIRPLLTNLFAGIQLAVTQPIRIGDAVIVENEWGWVEEITSTYVVIKIWDWRRLVVPLSYFLERPFQNWTRQTTDLIGSVLIWVDYTVPVAPIRTRLEQIARESKLWDGQVVNLQVVDSNERAIQLRALASARTSSDAWDLRCEVREKLIVYLQQEYPEALPKQRAELVDLAQRRTARQAG